MHHEGPMLRRTLTSNELWTLEYDEAASLLVARRTAEPMQLGGSAERMSATLAARAAGIDMRKTALLIDLRSGPMRNDEPFEEAMVTTRQHMVAAVRSFAKTAFLVRTAVGALQVKRYARAEGQELHVFEDEAAALAYLRLSSPRNASVR